MSDHKKNPGPPPDDFSKTTPNIPRADDVESGDWGKTNYGKFTPQPPGDEWGKTVTNLKPLNNDADYNKTFLPGAQNQKTPDWGFTEPNIRIPSDDFGGQKADDFSEKGGYGATAPFINLPEAERAKYQNLPPTPTEKAQQEKQEEKKKGGIPGWFWTAAGLLVMFFFALIVLLVVYLVFIRPTDFEVEISGLPADARVLVDNAEWSLSDASGTRKLKGLKANDERVIQIIHPNFTCSEIKVKGSAGESLKRTAQCAQKAVVATSPTPLVTKTGDDCQDIRLGEFDKAERCANAALDGLPAAPDFTADQLTKALNIFIINFDSGKFNIPSARLKFLRRASEYIMKLPATTVLEVGGHTDDKGNDASNQILSENRAKAVRETLVGFGVKPEALVTKGYGENSPKVPNTDDQNRFFNRRIEYKVIKQ